MANTLTAVLPKLLAQGLLALRQNAVMPLLVNRGYESMAGMKGSTIDVPIPSAVATQDVTPSNVLATSGDSAPTSVSIAMSQWKEAPFYLTDKDMMDAMSGIIPMQASEAIKSLANTVDAYIMSLYKGVYGYTGTAGTTPFGTTADATNVRTILNRQLAPLDDRRIVTDPAAEGNALNLQAFQSLQFSGSAMGLLEGTIGRKFGFNWFMDQNIPTHTAGTITTGLIAKASTVQAVGLATIVGTTAASTGACALVVGDIITIAGHTQTYTVTATATQASAATDINIAISPTLQRALAGSEAITVKSSHVVNLGFHRDAFAFASRPLASAVDGLGSLIQAATDEITGLTLRLEISRQHKQTRFSYDILYGAALIRPELACRLAG